MYSAARAFRGNCSRPFTCPDLETHGVSFNQPEGLVFGPDGNLHRIRGTLSFVSNSNSAASKDLGRLTRSHFAQRLTSAATRSAVGSFGRLEFVEDIRRKEICLAYRMEVVAMSFLDQRSSVRPARSKKAIGFRFIDRRSVMVQVT
jgi:hypothetical protein